MMIPDVVIQVAGSVGVSAQLLYAVCFTETRFRNTSNYKDPHFGSHGVCQVALPTAREQLPYVDQLALMQVRVNLQVAGLYLKKLSKKYNNNSYAVAAFNAGHVSIFDGAIMNQNYIDKVMNIYSKLDN